LFHRPEAPHLHRRPTKAARREDAGFLGREAEGQNCGRASGTQTHDRCTEKGPIGKDEGGLGEAEEGGGLAEIRAPDVVEKAVIQRRSKGRTV
jgi:hypothetical protein